MIAPTGGQLALVKMGRKVAAYPAVGVRGWGRVSGTATPAAKRWRMLIAYALWSDAFNCKRSFSIIPTGAEQTKIQRDFRYQGIIYLVTFYLPLCQNPKNAASSCSASR